MGVAVQFDYTAWAAIYTQFSTLTETQVTQGALPLAVTYHANDGSGPVSTAEIQTNLLNLMVAHICQLLYGINGQPPNGLVGRISNASEGSVSVGTDFPTTLSSAWLNQTTFGSMYWALTSVYRTMNYVPSARARYRTYF